MPYRSKSTRGPGGTRTTYTQSYKGLKRSSKITQSSGTKYNRVTSTTDLYTGKTKRYVTEKTADGWIRRKSLNPPKMPSLPKLKPIKTTRARKARKSEPIKLSTALILLVIILILTW